MALTDPKNCLAYHQSRVLTMHRDMSAVSLQKVVAAKKAFQQKDAQANLQPEKAAMQFYTMNRGMGMLIESRHPYEQLRPLEVDFVEAYYRMSGNIAVRSFYYLLEICTREARHNSSIKELQSGKPSAKAKAEKHVENLKQEFGEKIAAIHASTGHHESSIMKIVFEQTPDVPIGEYCRSLQWVYYNSQWPSSYGGPAWGGIADCLYRFVTGEFTAEIMLDTVWTLEHNTCAIFNKPNELFAHFVTRTPLLRRILDVQRSGQVPELVLHDQIAKTQVDPDLMKLAQTVDKLFPSKIGGYVDWFKVEALGAISKYSTEKAKQEQLHNLTPEQKAAMAKAKAEADAKQAAHQKALQEAKEKAAKEAAEKLANQFVVMPGLTIEKVKKLRAA